MSTLRTNASVISHSVEDLDLRRRGLVCLGEVCRDLRAACVDHRVRCDSQVFGLSWMDSRGVGSFRAQGLGLNFFQGTMLST